jgi:hypothetical protein
MREIEENRPLHRNERKRREWELLKQRFQDEEKDEEN